MRGVPEAERSRVIGAAMKDAVFHMRQKVLGNERMIQDRLQNLWKYVPEDKQEQIKKFTDQISESMPDGFYEIDGDEIYARIMSYPTRKGEACEIEAHDVYRDIQFSLTGVEGISIYQRDLLKPKTGDAENDFMTFYDVEAEPYIRILNLPGFFSMILPEEAHRPQESIDGTCAMVKKGVIKIKESCYE